MTVFHHSRSRKLSLSCCHWDLGDRKGILVSTWISLHYPTSVYGKRLCISPWFRYRKSITLDCFQSWDQNFGSICHPQLDVQHVFILSNSTKQKTAKIDAIPDTYNLSVGTLWDINPPTLHLDHRSNCWYYQFYTQQNTLDFHKENTFINQGPTQLIYACGKTKQQRISKMISCYFN